MKNLITFLVLGLVLASCDSSSKNSSSGELQNSAIKYEIDTSKWYVQEPKALIEFMDNLGQKAQFKEPEIVALYTHSEFPVMNYPSIMILNTKTSAAPPSLDQLEKQLGAMTMSLEDVENKMNLELSESIEGFDFKKPILIKEKRLIIMETTAQILGDQTLKIRQSMYFKGRNILAIQISYIEGKDEEYLEDFNKIVETITF